MAQRFGGKYSPDGKPATGPVAPPYPQQFVSPRRALYLAPLPLLYTAFAGGAGGMAIDLAAFAVLMLAAWLLHEGERAEAEYAARRVARRPAIPRKIFASILTGLGIALASWTGIASLFSALLYGVIATALHSFTFGFDPLRDKGMEGIDSFQSDRVARAVGEAEKHLKAMSDAILRAGDRKLEARVGAFQATARQMFRRVEEDPRDLTAARKYLSVYLLGARDATVKFADLYARNRDADARSEYAALLDDLESNFTKQTQALQGNDRSDLNVEIEVLRERLARDGVNI